MKIGDKFSMLQGALIPEDILSYKNLTSSSKLIFAKLIQHSYQNGSCSISHNILAKEIGMTKRCVINGIEELIKEKFIIKEKDIQSHKKNIYFFIWHECFKQTKQM